MDEGRRDGEEGVDRTISHDAEFPSSVPETAAGEEYDSERGAKEDDDDDFDGDDGEEVPVEYADDFGDEYDGADEYAIAEEGEEEAGAGAPEGEWLEAEEVVMRCTVPKESVYAVAVHPTLPLGICGDGDDTVTAWSFQTGDVVLHDKCHTDTVVSVGFSADGALFATASYDKTVHIWDSATLERIHTLEGPSEDIEWMAWHPHGPALLVGSRDCTVWLFEAKKGECITVLAGHEGAVLCGCFSSNGKQVLTGSEDGTVRVWSPRTGQCKHVFQGHGWCTDAVVCLVVHPSEPLVLAASQDGTARLANFKTKRILASYSHVPALGVDDAVDTIPREATASDSAAAAAGAGAGAGGGAAREGEEEEEVEVMVSVEGMGFCASQPWCATGATDGSLCVWDTKSHTCRHRMVQESSIITLKWHPRIPILFTGAADGTLRAFDARLGAQVLVVPVHRGMLLDMALFECELEDGSAEAEPGTGEEKAAARRRGFFMLTGGDDHSSAVVTIDGWQHREPS